MRRSLGDQAFCFGIEATPVSCHMQVSMRARELVRRILPRLKDYTALPSAGHAKAPRTGKGTRPPRAEGQNPGLRTQIDKIPR